MAEAAGTGLRLLSDDIAQLFGEDQARYLVACDAAGASTLLDAAQKAGVPAEQVGSFGGLAVQFGEDAGDLAELSQLYRTAFSKAIKGDTPDHA